MNIVLQMKIIERLIVANYCDDGIRCLRPFVPTRNRKDFMRFSAPQSYMVERDLKNPFS